MATQPSDSSKQRPRATVADELAVIVQRAQAFTNASGAAIAISEGQADEIICRARSGASAPDIGTALRVEGTFTGICIQSGKELRCDDAETDTRVDTAAIRSLGIRSMVVTPIKEDNKATGVLAVFAPTPHAFTITHVAVLKTMADQISALLARERRSPREEAHSEPAAVAMPKPPVAAPLPPPVVIKPSVTSSGAAAAPAPARVNVSTTAPKIEPARPAPAAEVAAPLPFPKREEKREEKRFESRPEPVAKPSLGTFDAMAGEQKKAPAKNFMVIGAVVAVLLIAGGGTWAWKSRKSSAPQPVAAVTNTAPAPQPPPAATSTTTPTAGAPAETANTAPANTKPAAAEKKNEPANKNTNTPKNEPPAKPSFASPSTVAMASGPSRISQGNSQPQSPDVAPSLAVGGNSSTALSSLAKSAGGPAPAVMARSEFTPIEPISQPHAVYPDIAKARRIDRKSV